jgi:hypothetical protein
MIRNTLKTPSATGPSVDMRKKILKNFQDFFAIIKIITNFALAIG